MYSFYQEVQLEIVNIKSMLDTLSELCTRRARNKMVTSDEKQELAKSKARRKESDSSKTSQDKVPVLSSGKSTTLRHSKTISGDVFTASAHRYRANSASDKKNKEGRKKDKKEHKPLLEHNFSSVDLGSH